MTKESNKVSFPFIPINPQIMKRPHPFGRSSFSTCRFAFRCRLVFSGLDFRYFNT